MNIVKKLKGGEKQVIKKTKLLIIALLLLFVSIGAVCAQENVTADDIAGTDNIDDVDDAVDVETPKLGQEQIGEVLSDGEVGNFTELSGLISGSAEGSTINLTKDYKRLPNEGYSYGITIGKQLTINGNGHTIDASNGARIFSVYGSNVVLKNITFTNAYNSNSLGTGAGIFVSDNSGNFKVINSTFKNLVASGASALDIRSIKSEVIDCRFIDNVAFKQYAAAIFLYGYNGKIINTTFTHNVANTTSSQMYNDGGAIYIFGNYATIDGCNFTDLCHNRWLQFYRQYTTENRRGSSLLWWILWNLKKL